MKEMLRAMWRTDRRSCLRIMLLNIAVSLTSGISLVLLLPMLELIDISAGGSQLLAPLQAIPYWGQAVLMVGIYIALITFKALLNRTASIRQTEFVETYTLQLRDQLYEAVSNADWQILAAKKSTDVINLFTSQCGQVSNGVRTVIGMISSLVSVAIQLVIACWMSVPVTLVVCTTGAGLLAVFQPLRKKSRSYGEEMIKISRNFYSELFNQMGSVKEIRTYGVEKEHAEKYGVIGRAFLDVQLRFAKLRATPNVVYSVASAVMVAVVFLFSVLVMKMETARLMILVYIFARLWPIFSGWQGQMQSIQMCVPALDKLQEAIDELTACKSEQMGTGRIEFEKQIQFEQVGFRYNDGEEDVLHDVDFTLNFGSITALVGPSGAGKSTTANLLMGFLHPTEGNILVDGEALTIENIRSWRGSIGYVPQDPLILNATLRENLQRFHPEATQDEMVAALKQSMAWPFVSKLPDGLDTVLGDQGVRLSGGERQRVVLARVLMSKPKLIILDEATSALDYESENAIRDVLRGLRGEATILIIAHRLATVLIADQAVVIDNGTVTESGTLKELLGRPESYISGMVTVE